MTTYHFRTSTNVIGQTYPVVFYPNCKIFTLYLLKDFFQDVNSFDLDGVISNQSTSLPVSLRIDVDNETIHIKTNSDLVTAGFIHPTNDDWVNLLDIIHFNKLEFDYDIDPNTLKKR